MSGIKVVRGVLTGFLVFLFLVAGISKISDQFFTKTHKQMKLDFMKFAKVHPAVLFGYQIDAEKYMKQIGMIELAGAFFLLVGPRFLKMLSCLILSSVMIGALYTLFKLEEPLINLAPASIILLLLFLKLHFLLIGNPKPGKDTKTTKID